MSNLLHSSPFLSREQLRLVLTGDGIAAENLGKRALVIDSQIVDSGIVREEERSGSGQLLFLCVRRPEVIPPLENVACRPMHPFGEPDDAGIVGETPLAWELRDQIAFLSACSPHVLVLGESGTGKELAAQAIHAGSSRRDKKLVARNAATFPTGLIDAELFGNAANYPNAGMPERIGLVGEADGSTLFLDEIGEAPHRVAEPLAARAGRRGRLPTTRRLEEAQGRRAAVCRDEPSPCCAQARSRRAIAAALGDARPERATRGRAAPRAAPLAPESAA